MARVVRCGLIQAKNELTPDHPLADVKQAMIDKHVRMVEEAAAKGVQILCLQEIFYGPYFCSEQDTRWYSTAERIPDGPTTELFQGLARKHQMVIVLPMYEEEMPGVY